MSNAREVIERMMAEHGPTFTITTPDGEVLRYGIGVHFTPIGVVAFNGDYLRRVEVSKNDEPIYQGTFCTPGGSNYEVWMNIYGEPRDDNAEAMAVLCQALGLTSSEVKEIGAGLTMTVLAHAVAELLREARGRQVAP